MRHPFDLELFELEAVHAHLQCLTEADMETISGGRFVGSPPITTDALGEEGGSTILTYEAGGAV